MKLRALILFLPFSVFLAETVKFPLEIKNTCSKISCMKGMAAGKCHGKVEHHKKLPGKCSSAADCSVCPVCSVFTFLHQYEWSSEYITFGKNYFFLNSGYASSYIPAPWKPPNG